MMNPEFQPLQHLIAKVVLRDQKAFKLLYDNTSSKLNGIAFCILGDSESCHEVLQEAYIQIWQHAHEYRPDITEPIVWMASIVRYRAYDKLRRIKRRPEGQPQLLSPAQQLFENMPAPDSKTAHCSLSKELNECLHILESGQRISVLLAYYFGYSRDEIAKQLKAPVNTIKSWLHRGLKRLKQCLET